MTTVRLGTGAGNVMGNGKGGMIRTEEDAIIHASRPPALLVSYFYLEQFLKIRDRLVIRDWAMDSGAYSAFNSGGVIDLGEYIDCCQRMLASDPQLTEVFSLDVIGDWRATKKNTEAMWAAGVPAIPVYHVKEPPALLKEMAAEYPKIALGGVAKLKAKWKNEFAEQCFARVWPKRIHGFGFGSERSILGLPFESVDATNWETGPASFGRWMAYGKLSTRGAGLNLRTEVEWYLKLEDRARIRWAKEMALIGAPQHSPTSRFVVAGTQDGRLHDAFGMEAREGHKVHRA